MNEIWIYFHFIHSFLVSVSTLIFTNNEIIKLPRAIKCLTGIPKIVQSVNSRFKNVVISMYKVYRNSKVHWSLTIFFMISFKHPYQYFIIFMKTTEVHNNLIIVNKAYQKCWKFLVALLSLISLNNFFQEKVLSLLLGDHIKYWSRQITLNS